MNPAKKLKNKYPFQIQDNFQPKIYCKVPESQIWFNRALFWFFGYNHEETIRCCEQGLIQEEQCAMLYFLKSLAFGINYNNCPDKLDSEQAKQQFEYWEKADLYKLEVNELETDLINALQRRVGDGVNLEHKNYDIQYSQELKKILEKYKNKVDKNTFNFLSVLTAESLMLLRPWDLWAQKTQPEKNIKYGQPFENTPLIQQIIENGLKQDDQHPGLRHIWIHFWELSPTPEKALCSNFKVKLRDISPDSGHLCHMPSHIEILCGKYQKAIESNMKGIEADDKYFQYIKDENLQKICFYTLYRCHNIHFLVYAALFAAKKEIALKYSNKMIQLVTLDYLKDELYIKPSGADWLEAFVPIKIHVLIRFGMWEQLIDDEPFGKDVLPMQQINENPKIYCATLAYTQYGKGIAYAVLAGKKENNKNKYIQLARESYDKFIQERNKVPNSRKVFNNTQQDVLQIAEQMLIGELNYREKNYSKAFEALKKAVHLDDNLPYDEPWGWMVPTRHSLAALLLEQGIQNKNDDMVKESMEIYKEDLGDGMKRCVQHQGNVWSLVGLNKCYNYFKMEKEIQDLKPELEKRLEQTDIQINSSCQCSLDKNFM